MYSMISYYLQSVHASMEKKLLSFAMTLTKFYNTLVRFFTT